MNTVNVIEYYSGTVQAVYSFSDDKDGNSDAEKLFVRIAMENSMDARDTGAALEEGLYEDGDYQVFITHSMNEMMPSLKFT
jgi:hypothetical protein